MRAVRLFLSMAVLFLTLPVAAQITPDRPLPDPSLYHADSGLRANPDRVERVVYEEIVHLESAAWIRVYFGDVDLAEGSRLCLTSTFDGESQELDAGGLAQWSQTSAYFNGDTVTVELVAAPLSVGNRFVIERVGWEALPPVATGDCGFCGVDEREPSEVDWAARLLPAGCSASIYNPDSCSVSAGHCIGGSMVIQFKVPLSNPNCSLNQPPIAEQFPVLQFSFANTGVGNDWAAMTIGTNTLGEEPFDRYGVFKPIASSPPEAGQSVTVWGYGVDNQCILNQVQQTSSGVVDSVQSLSFRHTTDVTFGNSGSGVLRDGVEIMGIVTHCPCPTHATRVDHPSFAAARESLCPMSPPQTAPLVSAEVLIGTFVSGAVAQLQADDDQYFFVDSVTAGVRNSTLTEITAQSPFTAVSKLNLSVVLGPANANPVFMAVQLFDHSGGSWDTLQFGIVSDAGETVVDLQDIESPNSYVGPTGEIRVRVGQTARELQTPDGFTKLIDFVSVSVQP